MKADTAIKVNYWVSGDQPAKFAEQIDGIDEFKNELEKEFVTTINGQPSGAGGGIAFIVDLISPISLSHLAKIVLEGVTFDLIKSGSNAFVLKPFISAFKHLRNRNNGNIDLTELRIYFNDSTVIIHDILVASPIDYIPEIITMLANNYNNFCIDDDKYPDTIHIPVIEDIAPDRPFRFRIIENYDEVIRANSSTDYFRFWGLEYESGKTLKTYDVSKMTIIDDEFATLGQYYSIIDKRQNQQ